MKGSKHTWPLRRGLTVALTLIVALTMLADRAFEYGVVHTRDLEQEHLNAAREMGYTLARDYSQILLAGNMDELRLSVAAHGTRSMVENVAVADGHGKVLASTHLSDQDRAIAAVSPYFDSATAEEAIKQNRIQVRLDDSRDHVLGYAPISLPPAAGELRSLGSGLLFIQLDLAPLKAANWQHLYSPENLLRWAATLAIVVLLLGYLLQRHLFRPLRHLSKVASRLGQGDWEARSELEGESELAALGRVFNEMRDQLSADRQSLLESEGRFRTLVETSPLPMLITTVPPVNRVLLMNRRFTELFGYRIEEIPDIAAWWLRAYPDPEQRREVHERWTKAVGTMITGEVEHIGPVAAEVTCLDGQRRFVEVRMTVQGERSLVVFNDLTERIAYETELEQHRNRLEELVAQRAGELAAANRRLRRTQYAVDHAALAVFWISLPDGHFEYANEHACRYLGYPLDELLRIGVFDINPDIDESIFLDKILPRIREQGSLTFESHHRRKSGEIIPVEITSFLAEFEDGERIISFVSDITTRVEAREALHHAKESAEAANRAKTIFLANMSHELRTPLNAILGFSQLMAHDHGLSAEQRRNLETVYSSGQHLLALINDILEISRIETGRLSFDPQSFDLQELLAGLTEASAPRATLKGMTLRLEAAPDLPRYITSDLQKLRQILSNLICNAIKYTERGEVSIVAAMPPDAEPPVLRIEVRDTGEGIAEAELEQLFQPFYQTEQGVRLGEGTGLGLTISREYAKLLGGTLSVTSLIGKGSTFRLELPVTRAAAATCPAHDRRVQGLAPGQPSPRILVTGDRPEDHDLIVRQLEGAGCEVRVATGTEETLTLVRSWRPDLIFLDIHSRDGVGFATAGAIRALPDGERPPMVALTATARQADEPILLAAGCRAVMSQPLDAERLFETLGTLLGLRFVYDGEHEAAAPKAPPLKPLLDTLPKTVRQRLRTACIELDSNEVMRSADAVEQVSPQAAAAIRDLAAQFRFEEIARELPDRNDESTTEPMESP